MVRRICDKYGVLLIVDEVINAFGRTGKMFAIEHFDFLPDMMTVAKGITSGCQPVGACIVREHVMEPFIGGAAESFQHGYTYGGHPAGAAAGWLISTYWSARTCPEIRLAWALTCWTGSHPSRSTPSSVTSVDWA